MRRVRYELCPVDSIPPDEGRRFPLGDSGECVLFFHQGEWSATGAVCPHQNAPLDGAPASEGNLTCRRHGYRFSLKSGECLTLGGYGVPVFDVRVENGLVSVELWEYDD